MPDPNIIGGSRVARSAGIVLGCILLCGVVVILASFLDSPVPADLHVGAGFFLKG